MGCIFCNIVEGKMPCYKIYEDELVVAFLDIGPVNPGHALVIPKEHFENLEDVPEELLCEVMKAVKKIGKLLKEKLQVPGYNVLENNDPVAGQIIPHLHFHIIPRHEGDGNEPWKQGKYNPGEAEEIVEKMNNE